MGTDRWRVFVRSVIQRRSLSSYKWRQLLFLLYRPSYFYHFRWRLLFLKKQLDRNRFDGCATFEFFWSFFISFFDRRQSDSDCILHGYIKKLGGPFASAWQTRYARLYPNRLELHYESSSSKPELVLMDHIEEINSELTTFKGEQSILLRTKEGGRVVLTNQVRMPQLGCLNKTRKSYFCNWKEIIQATLLFSLFPCDRRSAIFSFFLVSRFRLGSVLERTTGS